MDTKQKQNPPTKVKVLFNIDAETDAMLDQMTDNRSWLVNKMIRDAWLRDFSAEKRGKILRKQPVKAMS